MITCNLDRKQMLWQPERFDDYAAITVRASVGKVCAWGGFTIAEISTEVPEGERNEYARDITVRYNAHDRLVEALEISTDQLEAAAYHYGNAVIKDRADSNRTLLAELDDAGYRKGVKE